MTTPDLRAATAAALTGSADVRGLTVRQPWAASIAHLGKRIENRTRPIAYTGLIAVQAAKAPDRAALREAPADLPGRDVRGAVVAVARLTGCHCSLDCGGSCSDWAQLPDETDPAARPVWHWQLADVLPLHRPVQATGALCLWRPSPELRHRITAALTEETE
ncbi:ASCH domain-containing protein [Streptomyces mangrovi]|uniref:hypothetical protein n=1 Tax=Streptomyces mangrovi TaxID=1206892 RepID=UPI00399D25D2